MKCGVNFQRSGAENLNNGVFNQQPSTHTALWTVDGHLGNWSLKKRLESPQSPPN
jgi:hypothetical protein